MSAELQFTRATAVGEIDRIYDLQQKRKAAVAATTAAQRIEKLKRIETLLLDHRDDIRAAMWADYRKPAAEVDISEVYAGVSEARHARRHLRRWMKAHRVSTPLSLLGSRSKITYEPKGVVLIISPWNFPFNLTFGPLVSAVAAGNCAMLKPSEMTPNSSALMKKILGEVFDESEVAVIEGDADVAQALLKKRFDHIFFTGSPRVGRIVMKAAAEFLTSVTLELGGKSPAIVDRTANLDEAAKKIAWGKCFNSGQICIAPDYLLVDETVHDSFLEKLRAQIATLGGEGSRGLLVTPAYANRIRQLYDDALQRGAKVVAGGEFKERDFPVAVLENVSPDALMMQQEIFGPLLPLSTYRSVDDALQTIVRREKPLTLYLFSRSRKLIRDVVAKTTAGSTAINETLIQFFQLYLPFGGVGESGVGKSHGFFGFQAFSNARAILSQPLPFSGIQLMYPPYTKFKQRIIDLTLKYL